MSTLWMTIEPAAEETRFELSDGRSRPVLRARLPLMPREPRSLTLLLESLAGWYGRGLTAVVAADAPDVRRHPERWAVLLGDLDGERVRAEWIARPDERERDRFLGAMGDFRVARRLVGLAEGGRR